MVNHLTNGPAFRPILGVQLGFGKPFNPSPQVSGKGFDILGPGLDMALINIGRRLEPANRIAQGYVSEVLQKGLRWERAVVLQLWATAAGRLKSS